MVLEHLVLRGTFTSGENKMTIDINKLRRLAQAATPGPWIAAGPSFGESLPKYLNEVVVDREGDEDDCYSICGASIGLDKEDSDDMAFIAAVNPSAISELLDRLEAVKKERDVLRDRLALESQENGALRDSVDRACEERDALRAKIAEMERRGVGFRERCTPSSPTGYSNRFPLYALPGAKGDEE